MLLSLKLANTILLISIAVAAFTSTVVFAKLISISLLQTGEIIREDKTLVGVATTKVYENSYYILPISWGAVVGTLMWKGRVRSVWMKQGYDYNTFRVVARMRGSPTRIKLLNSLSLPKNKMQLAKELEMDWNTIDDHVKVLQRHNLIEELALIGNAKYYIISEQGKKVLVLILDEKDSKSKGGSS